MNIATKILTLASAGLISACGALSLSNNAQVSSTTLSVEGEHAYYLKNNQWLNFGPENNIQLSDEQGQAIQVLNVQAELMDTRYVDGNPFIFTLDDQQRPSILRNNDGQLSIIHAPRVNMPIEGLCLYQSANSPMQVFLMDEDALAHQYYIKENASSFELKHLRTFSLPPLAEYCAVHDTTDQFVVSEEDIGVWVYSARAESEVKREAIDLVKPYGRLNNSGPLAIIDNTLYLAELGENTLQTYQLNDQTFIHSASITLKDGVELDSLTAQKLNYQTVLFNAVNDSNAKLISWTLPLTQSDLISTHIKSIKPIVQTQAVTNKGDAADDPAIWVHPKGANKSLVIGTNKKRGLYVYDLTGKQTQELLVGRVNNVDVRQGFTLKGKPRDIAAASQRDRNTIALFSIHPTTGKLTKENEIQTGLDHVYGLCMYQGLNDNVYVFINDTDGRFEQWLIQDQAKGWSGKLVREFSVATQPEGCTADEDTQRLFIGEENAAVWVLGAEPNDASPMELVSKAGDILTADIEGMEIYNDGKEKWLVVSSQGNDSYVIFNAEAPYEFKGEFRIGLNEELAIDGASETDGLTVSAVAFNKDFPEGMLVVQDGRNLLPTENQNFKLVSWRDIRLALDL